MSAAARRAKMISALALAAIVGAGFWVAFTASRSRVTSGPTKGVRLLTLERPFPAEGRYPSDPYIGPRVCAECHPGEFALHARSGHARTLSPASRRVLARGLDGKTVSDPESPEVLWSYAYRDGQLHIARKEQNQVEERVAEYAFGSGHHAMTFVSVIDPWVPAILEHRITYYTKQQGLGLTPGHDAPPRPPGKAPHGGVVSPGNARKCFGCHTTQASARDQRPIDEETMIPNVTCERCHGPGRAHVLAARRGAADAELELPFGPNRFTADSLLTLCGTCHRHPSRSQPGQIRPDDPHLARFQPVGILQSRCFRESGGALSCVTCHDPHARASSDRAAYLAVCLSCHSGAAPSPTGSHARPLNAATAGGVPCPIEPRGDCVDCHMPRVEAGQHIRFADHWIRIRRPGESALPLRGPEPNFQLLDTPDP
jgi:hypothetical protein